MTLWNTSSEGCPFPKTNWGWSASTRRPSSRSVPQVTQLISPPFVSFCSVLPWRYSAISPSIPTHILPEWVIPDLLSHPRCCSPRAAAPGVAASKRPQMQRGCLDKPRPRVSEARTFQDLSLCCVTQARSSRTRLVLFVDREALRF